MATENREQYDENQAILIETIQTVKDFLDKELSRYDTWEEFSSLENKGTKYLIIKSEYAF